MMLTFKRVALGTAAVVAGAMPAVALAQGPFQDGSNAPNAQYGTTPTTTTTTTTTATATATTTVTVTSQPPTPVEPSSQAPVQTVPTGPVTTTPEGDDEGDPDDAIRGAGDDDGPGDGDSAPSRAEGGDGAGGGSGRGAGDGTGRLAPCGAGIAVITLGKADEDMFDDVVEALRTPDYSAVLRQPVAAQRLAGTPVTRAGLIRAGAAAGFSLPRNEDPFRRLATEDSTGKSVLFGDSLEGELEGVRMVVFLATPEASSLSKAEARNRRAFITGLVRGLQRVRRSCAVQVVATEQSGTPTELSLYQQLGLSTVDNVDQATGKQALGALAVGYDGRFGVKDAAQAVLPTGPDGKPVRVSAATAADRPAEQALDGSPVWGLLVIALAAAASLGTLVVKRRTRRFGRPSR